MPHNECSFGIILGLYDMKKLGYKIGTELEEDKVIFEHRGRTKGRKMKHVEQANEIMERLDNMPSYAWQDRNLQLYEKIEERVKEECLNSDYTEDTETDSDESSESDDDDDDGN